MHIILRPIRLIAISSVVACAATVAVAATIATPTMPIGAFGDVLMAQAAQPKAQPKAQPQAPRMDVTVFVAQQELKVRGFDPGPADGRLGPKTTAAIRAFQAKQKIPVNGTLDARTIAALGIRV
jgi:peptidoglycan hydrolase-like protein with peptidoglycan-binding domain